MLNMGARLKRWPCVPISASARLSPVKPQQLLDTTRAGNSDSRLALGVAVFVPSGLISLGITIIQPIEPLA